MGKNVAAMVGVILLLPGLSWAESEMPDQLVRETTVKITALLKANRDEYTKDHQKLYAMVYENILPHFDFRAMSRQVLGRYWRQANEDQRTRFADEFRDLLVRTYATALLKYTDGEIAYLPFNWKPGDRTAIVRTEVKQGSGAPNVPIYYSFYRKNSAWKVYDVTIEGISLVTNYRSAYADKIRKEGIDALIASISQSNREDQGAGPGKDRKKGGAG